VLVDLGDGDWRVAVDERFCELRAQLVEQLAPMRAYPE